MSSSHTHPFDLAISLTGENGLYRGETSPRYANMIGPFGGISAATMMHAVLSESKAEGEPVAATFNFSAPIKDGSFEIVASPVKLSRSTQHWMVELRQNNSTCMNATVILGKRRDTFSETESPFPRVPEYESVEIMPSLGLPEWVNNYRFRIIEGGFGPTFGQHDDHVGDSKTVQWIEDHPPRPLDFTSLTSISDIFFPRVFVKRQTVMPVGTISLTIHFHAQDEDLAEVGTHAILGAARSSTFSKGFFDQVSELWSPSQKLLATTSQMVYFKD